MALAPLLFMTGCAFQTAPSPARDLAESFLAARSADRALRAFRAEDEAGLEAAARDLELTAPAQKERIARAFVPTLTLRAFEADALAQKTPDSALRARADRSYRIALRFLPADYHAILSLDLQPEILNGLGYFLADRGSARADFLLAEFLTAVSLHEYSKLAGDPNLTEQQASRLRFFRAVGPGDSHAWALFRQRRFVEAKRAQERVMMTIASEINDGARGEKLSADLPFHLAEIYRALGENESALRQYKRALTLQPDAPVRAQIEAGLRAIR